jgi:hypothetical protein
MARAAALPIARPAGTQPRSRVRPPVSLRVVHSRPRRRPRGPQPFLITLEWLVLTMVGVVVLSLATG